MQTIPANIVKFLSNHHVVSIAAAEEGEVWAACCFYVFDEVNARIDCADIFENEVMADDESFCQK